MTFPDFLFSSWSKLFLIFNQMLSIGSFGRHAIGIWDEGDGLVDMFNLLCSGNP